MRTIDENRLLKLAGSITLIVFAFSIGYRYVVSPELRQIKLSNCLERVQERKDEVNKANASNTSDSSLYERFQAGELEGYQVINVKSEQEECYKRYK